MRLLPFAALLLSVPARAGEFDTCVEVADRIARVRDTCGPARSLDCVPDLVLALRAGTPAQATEAAGLLAAQPNVTVALGWALASKAVDRAAVERVDAQLRGACDGGDARACSVRRSASGAAPRPASGLVDPAELAKTVKRRTPSVQRCYERRLACDRRARGTVRLVLRVDPEGLVTAASAESGLSADVDACVLASVSRWRFPAPKGGEALVRFPLVFAAGD